MILEILETIASDNGKKFKLAELEKHKGNELLIAVLKKAYCPLTQFYIRKIPTYSPQTDSASDLTWALRELSVLSDRIKTGKEATKHLGWVLSQLNSSDSTVIERIIGKDLKAGFSASSINKVFGKSTIKETPYMGAISYNKKKVAQMFEDHESVFSEVKMDGRYTNIKITENDVYMESRQGKETDFGNTFKNLIKIRDHFGFDVVLNGELIMDGMDRYTSNGAIASIVSISNKNNVGECIEKHEKKFLKEYGETYYEMMEKIIVVVWDYIPLKDYEDTASWDVIRKDRGHSLEYSLSSVLKLHNIRFIEALEVEDVAAAMEHFQKMLARGEEGTILKGSDGKWKDGKPKWQVKFKIEMDVDLKIVGFNYGTKDTKNEHVISSLTVQTEDGILETKPAGITEKDMKFITENQEALLNTIIEAKCSGLSSDREGNYALLHPVFKGFRDDKTVADTLEQVKANEEMIKAL